MVNHLLIRNMPTTSTPPFFSHNFGHGEFSYTKRKTSNVLSIYLHLCVFVYVCLRPILIARNKYLKVLWVFVTITIPQNSKNFSPWLMGFRMVEINRLPAMPTRTWLKSRRRQQRRTTPKEVVVPLHEVPLCVHKHSLEAYKLVLPSVHRRALNNGHSQYSKMLFVKS